MNRKERDIHTFQRQDFGQDHGTRGTKFQLSYGEEYTESARRNKELLRESVSASGQTNVFDSTGFATSAEPPQLVMSAESDGYALHPITLQSDYNGMREDEVADYGEFAAILDRHNISAEDKATAAMVFAKSSAVRAMVRDVALTPPQSTRGGSIIRPRR